MSTVAPTRYRPLDSYAAVSDTNLDKTAAGRRATTVEGPRDPANPAAAMNDMNPLAMPFQPGGGSNDPRAWSGGRDSNNHNNMAPPPMPLPPYGMPGVHWNPNFHPPPPPPPPPFWPGNQNGFSQHDDFHQAQAYEQSRAQHNQWPQNYGYGGGGPPPHFPPFGQHQQPMFPAQQHQFPPHFQQSRGPMIQPGFPHAAHYSTMQQVNWPNGATNQEIQYAFSALVEGMRSKRKRGTDTDDRVPTQPSKKNKKARAKAKAGAANDLEETQEYGSLHRVDPVDISSSRIDKRYRSTPPPAQNGTKGKYGDHKIMLPAPQPTDLYLDQAAEEPTVVDPAGHVLVILDLNGTVLYRPNKNAKTMIARPYLRPFLQYLFQNFKVMVWSSAKPENVKALVEKALDKDLRAMLVSTWGRDTFGLSSKYYNQNVQVYKNLRLVWSRDVIQQHHPEYATGGRFGQHNTVLIDDSALKASAQPHNLLEIPEFEATPEQMEGDVLREVAGYLEIIRHQGDVSKFIHKQPFKSGIWNFDWPDESGPAGDIEEKITLKSGAKNASPAAAGKKKKKGKSAAAGAALSPGVTDSSRATSPAPAGPMSAVTDSLTSVTLSAKQSQSRLVGDW